MDNDGREFFSAGAVSNDQLDTLPARILSLMGRIRPHAVSLVDAWSVPDYLLDRYVFRFLIPYFITSLTLLTLTARSAATMVGCTKTCSIAHIARIHSTRSPSIQITAQKR